MKTKRNIITIFAVTSLTVASLPFATFALGPNDPPQVVEKQRARKVAAAGEKLRAIANHMEAAHFQLSRKTTGEPTQQDQVRAVALIEELIKELMDEQGPTGGKPPIPPKPPRPAEESKLPNPSPEGPLVLEPVGEVDGRINLPPAQLQRLMHELSEKFPDRYRDILAEYFKQLSGKR
jgi:hypothetical protein